MLTLTDHLEELRKRLFNCLGAIGVGSILGYVFSDSLLEIILKPLWDQGEAVYFFSVPEAFIVKLKIALITGLLLSLPFILWQAWSFIAPGLHEHEKRWTRVLLYSSLALFVIGALFGFFLVIPVGIRFLMSFQSHLVRPMISVSQYVSFIGMMVLAFGIMFEFPALMVGLVLIGIVSTETLSRWRKWIIVGIVFLAALLTPGPDVASQILLATPLYVLFEACLLLARFLEARQKAAGQVVGPLARSPQK
jgi:sec-independent protein translocase protein TatC